MAFGERFNPGLDMVCGNGDGLVRDCGIEGYHEKQVAGSREQVTRIKRERIRVKRFVHGVIAGAVASVIVFGVICAFRFFHNRDKELIKYVETQNEIQMLQEDYNNRDPYEFLEDPGVRRAADNADAEFRRKRDEAVQRIRNGHAD
jgi:hypothetical protein